MKFLKPKIRFTSFWTCWRVGPCTSESSIVPPSTAKKSEICFSNCWSHSATCTNKGSCTGTSSLKTFCSDSHSKLPFKRQIQTIVLADFGLACNADEPQYLFTRCGTPGFVAPEILNSNE